MSIKDPYKLFKSGIKQSNEDLSQMMPKSFTNSSQDFSNSTLNSIDFNYQDFSSYQLQKDMNSEVKQNTMENYNNQDVVQQNEIKTLNRTLNDEKATLSTIQKDSIQKKIVEKAQKKDESILTKTMDYVNAPFRAMLGALEGVFAYDDPDLNSEGSLFQRIITGIETGVENKTDENGNPIVSTAGLAHTILSGNADTSTWSPITNFLVGSVVLGSISFLDPVQLGFTMLGRSSHAMKAMNELKQTLRYGYTGKKYIDVGQNILSENPETYAQLMTQYNIVQDENIKAHSKALQDTYGKKEYKGMKAALKRSNYETKTHAKNLKQELSDFQNTYQGTVGLEQQRLTAETSKNIRDLVENIIANKDYDTLDELNVLKRNLLKSEAENLPTAMTKLEQVWARSDHDKAYLIDLINRDVSKNIEEGSKTSIYEICSELLGKTKKRHYGFSANQIKESLPTHILESGLIDLPSVYDSYLKFYLDNPIVKDFGDNVNEKIIKKYNNLNIELQDKNKRKLLNAANLKTYKKELNSLQDLINQHNDLELLNYTINPKDNPFPSFLKSKDEQNLLSIADNLNALTSGGEDRLNALINNLSTNLNIQTKLESNLKSNKTLLNKLNKEYKEDLIAYNLFATNQDIKPLSTIISKFDKIENNYKKQYEQKTSLFNNKVDKVNKVIDENNKKISDLMHDTLNKQTQINSKYFKDLESINNNKNSFKTKLLQKDAKRTLKKTETQNLKFTNQQIINELKKENEKHLKTLDKYRYDYHNWEQETNNRFNLENTQVFKDFNINLGDMKDLFNIRVNPNLKFDNFSEQNMKKLSKMRDNLENKHNIIQNLIKSIEWDYGQHISNTNSFSGIVNDINKIFPKFLHWGRDYSELASKFIEWDTSNIVDKENPLLRNQNYYKRILNIMDDPSKKIEDFLPKNLMNKLEQESFNGANPATIEGEVFNQAAFNYGKQIKQLLEEVANNYEFSKDFLNNTTNFNILDTEMNYKNTLKNIVLNEFGQKNISGLTRGIWKFKKGAKKIESVISDIALNSNKTLYGDDIEKLLFDEWNGSSNVLVPTGKKETSLNNIYDSHKNYINNNLINDPNDPRVLESKWRILSKFINIHPGNGVKSELWTFDFAKDKEGKLTKEAQDLKNNMEEIFSINQDDINLNQMPVISAPMILQGFNKIIGVGGSGQKYYNPQLRKIQASLRNLNSVSPREGLRSLLDSSGGDLQTLINEANKMGFDTNNWQTLDKKQITELILNNFTKFQNTITGEFYGNKDWFMPKVQNKFHNTSAKSYKGKSGSVSLFDNKFNAQSFVGRVSDINEKLRQGFSKIDKINLNNKLFNQFKNENNFKILQSLGYDSIRSFKKDILDNQLSYDKKTNILQKIYNKDKTILKPYMDNILSKKFNDAILEYYAEDRNLTLTNNKLLQFFKHFKNNNPTIYDDLDFIIENINLNEPEMIQQAFETLINKDLLNNKTLNNLKKEDWIPRSVLNDWQFLNDESFTKKISDNFNKKEEVYKNDSLNQQFFNDNGIYTAQQAANLTSKLGENILIVKHLIENNVFKSAEEIHTLDINNNTKVSFDEVKKTLHDFFEMSLQGSRDSKLGLEDSKNVNEATSVVMNYLNDLTKKTEKSQDTNHLYIPTEFYKAVFKKDTKIDHNFHKILSIYDKFMSGWKKLTLMTPSFHFNNFFGNMFMAYMDTGKLSDSAKLYANGHALKKSLYKLDNYRNNFRQKYIEEHGSHNISDIEDAFIKDLKDNPDKYKDLNTKIQTIDTSQKNTILPKFSTKVLNYNPLDIYHLSKEAEKLGLQSNKILEEVFGQKVSKFITDSQQIKDLGTSKISFDQFSKLYPEVVDYLYQTGFSKDNMIQKISDMNFKIAKEDTLFWKLGIFDQISQYERATFAKKAINWRIDRMISPTEYVNFFNKLDDGGKEKFALEMDKILQSRYHDTNKTRIIKDRTFDSSKMNSFESRYLNRIFPFYNFTKKSLMLQWNQIKNLDFKGYYSLGRLVRNLSSNLSIANDKKSPYAQNANLIPLITPRNDDDAIYLKTLNPIKLNIPNQTLLNDIANKTNPFVKYIISSAAGNENLYFNNSYKSKLAQIYDIFAPSIIKKPSQIKRSRQDMSENANTLEQLISFFPGIFRIEDTSTNKIQKLQDAIDALMAYMDDMSINNREQLFIQQKLFPWIGYTPFKVDM